MCAAHLICLKFSSENLRQQVDDETLNHNFCKRDCTEMKSASNLGAWGTWECSPNVLTLGKPSSLVVTVTLEMAYNPPGTEREDGQVGRTAALF